MRLDHTIATRFAADELAALAAELGLAANEHNAAPADLAATLAARGRAADLLAALSARAPDVAWAALEWPPAALAALHDALDRRLDADGLRDLCLRLGVDPDNLPGETKRARARELVRAMARAGRVGELRVASGEWQVPNSAPPMLRHSPPATRHSSLVARHSSLCLSSLWRLSSSGASGRQATHGGPPLTRHRPPATRHSPWP